MNHCVPGFEMDEDYSIPPSSGFARPKQPPTAEDEIMELLWQNGQVVMQSQNQRSIKRSHMGDSVIPAEQSAAREIRHEEESANQLFMQEDEMASWLHCPIDDSSFDQDFYADLTYSAPCATVASPIADVRMTVPPASKAPPAPLPPIPPPRDDVEHTARFQSFVHFSKPKGIMEPGPLSSNKAARDSTIVDSNETPAAGAPESRASLVFGSTSRVSSPNIGCSTMSCPAPVGTTSAGAGGSRERGMCELTVTSSPGGSGASISASPEPIHRPPPPMTEDRKRKGREADDADSQNKDIRFESPDVKQVHGSTSTKRSRAAEVHNLSERRRRDRINEKMKALQGLIPRCNKSDKASMLDEAIEYLKSLQLQVQIMSMGCSMVPMMFPGFQQYNPGMGMGMGMGMEMGMTQPMMPFPSVLAGSTLPTPAAATHLGPRFPVPAFHMQPVAMPDPSRIQTNQSDPTSNSIPTQNPNQSRMPNFPDPYQLYLSLHQTQIPAQENQATMQPSNGGAKQGS